MDDETGKKNVFEMSSLIPYKHECSHAVKLVKLCGKSTNFQYKDCYDHISDPPDDLECSRLGKRMEERWLQELKLKGPGRASLTWVLFRCLLWDFLSCVSTAFFVRIVFIFMMIDTFRRTLKEVADFAEFRDSSVVANLTHNITLISATDPIQQLVIPSMDDPHFNDLYKRVILSTLCHFSSLLFFYMSIAHLKLKLARCGLKCRVAMTQLIQRKSLRLHLATSIRESSIKALSLISNEVTFIEEANKFIVYMVMGPLSLSMCTFWAVYTQVGWQPVLYSFPLLILYLAIQLNMPKLYKKISRERKSITNKRIDTMNTFLNSIKIVKMYAWEPKFLEKVNEFRTEELKQVKFLNNFNIFDLISLGLMAKLLTAIIFLAYIYTYNQLNPEILFNISIVYNLTRLDMLFYFPKSIRCLTDVQIACKNIKLYLLLDDAKDDRRIGYTLGGKILLELKNLCVSHDSNQSTIAVASKFSISELSATKISTQLISVIDRLNIRIEAGDLTFVLGQVGSGKSTLLLTLLGETHISSGSLEMKEGLRISYASQEPCIFSDTFKNNILLGRPLNEERYKQVVHACCLWYDINLLPEGDETIVGPKGVSLSGGQKARLSLARAIYSQADVYLLDDPLSAVDTKVASHIMTKCIREFLAGKTVVMVTHQVQFLSFASRVVILSRNSAPVFGSLDEVSHLQEYKNLLNDCKERHSTSEELNDSPKLIILPIKSSTDTENCRSLLSNNVAGKNRESSYGFIMLQGWTKIGLVFLALNSVLYVAISALSDYYFRIWSKKVLEVSDTESFDEQDTSAHLLKYWLIYMLIILLYAISPYLFAQQLCLGLQRASSELHAKMVSSLFNAKMLFYDFCRMGELSSRYAGDFATIDHTLQYLILLVALILVSILATFIPMAIINPLHIMPFVGLYVVCCPLAAKRYRILKRLMALSKDLRSPVYSNLSSSIEELNTIRSDQDYLSCMRQKFDSSQNKMTSMTLLSYIFENRTSTSLRLATMLMFSTMLYIMIGVYWQDLDVSTTGTFLLIAINAVFSFPALMEYGFSLESAMISVNSVRRYTELEPEAELVTADHQESACKWKVGQISFNQVTLRYFADERPAIDGLTFEIAGGERVAVVGRTGAGKSSIISVLYRLYSYDGIITIDGVDTKSLPLAELRSSLGVIPQDPVLFCDSLRKNLDPFAVYSDLQIWHALEVVSLRQFVAQSLQTGLDHIINEGGRNFSAGQRQLICLARAVLRAPKVLLIDEATANVDSDTDALIQRTIRSHFTQCTIITIAHRLDTVLDYDRVMVMDAGKIVEFDSAKRLLEKEGGLFRSMFYGSSGR